MEDNKNQEKAAKLIKKKGQQNRKADNLIGEISLRNMEPAWEKVAGLKFQPGSYKDTNGQLRPNRISIDKTAANQGSERDSTRYRGGNFQMRVSLRSCVMSVIKDFGLGRGFPAHNIYK